MHLSDFRNVASFRNQGARCLKLDWGQNWRTHFARFHLYKIRGGVDDISKSGLVYDPTSGMLLSWELRRLLDSTHYCSPFSEALLAPRSQRWGVTSIKFGDKRHQSLIISTWFLANVNSGSRFTFMFAICQRPSVCSLSSVCNVCEPY